MQRRFDRYELIRPIASGGMGTVHLARVVGAGGFERRVALKVMHPGLVGDQQFVNMFLDEARFAARIHHPNVVSTIDVGQHDRRVFLAMEWIEGPPLNAIFDALHPGGERMPLEVACRIVVDMLCGLHAAHELRDADGEPLNLVHRDVSPHNVLVGADGIARLTDFGVARARARLQTTQGRLLKGKLCYLAPEQARCQDFDRRADIFSAGIVLWEALTGRMLYDAESEVEAIALAAGGPTATPASVNPMVPAAVDAACMRALAVAPDERYPTALAFAEAIEEAAANTGVRLPAARGVAAFIEAIRPRVEMVEPAMSMSDAERGAEEIMEGLHGAGAGAGDAPSVEDKETAVEDDGGESSLAGTAAAADTRSESRRKLSRETPAAVASQPPPRPKDAALARWIGLAAVIAGLGAGLVIAWPRRASDPGPASGREEAPAPPAAPSRSGETLPAQAPASPASASPVPASAASSGSAPAASASAAASAQAAPSARPAASGAAGLRPRPPGAPESPVERPFKPDRL
jgi:serine/threonine-protein kinase